MKLNQRSSSSNHNTISIQLSTLTFPLTSDSKILFSFKRLEFHLIGNSMKWVHHSITHKHKHTCFSMVVEWHWFNKRKWRHSFNVRCMIRKHFSIDNNMIIMSPYEYGSEFNFLFMNEKGNGSESTINLVLVLTNSHTLFYRQNFPFSIDIVV